MIMMMTLHETLVTEAHKRDLEVTSGRRQTRVRFLLQVGVSTDTSPPKPSLWEVDTLRHLSESRKPATSLEIQRHGPTVQQLKQLLLLVRRGHSIERSHS